MKITWLLSINKGLPGAQGHKTHHIFLHKLSVEQASMMERGSAFLAFQDLYYNDFSSPKDLTGFSCRSSFVQVIPWAWNSHSNITTICLTETSCIKQEKSMEVLWTYKSACSWVRHPSSSVLYGLTAPQLSGFQIEICPLPLGKGQTLKQRPSACKFGLHPGLFCTLGKANYTLPIFSWL